MNNYPEDFETLWKLYPKRVGGNSKKKAYRMYMARLKEFDHPYLFFGMQRYKAYCEAAGKIGTELVMQAATFFGPDEHFVDDWDLPVKKEAAIKLPFDDNQLASFAAKHGYPKAKPGELAHEYRGRLREAAR